MLMYCMKCKKKVEVTPSSSKKTKNGGVLHKGTCGKCKGKVATFGKR